MTSTQQLRTTGFPRLYVPPEQEGGLGGNPRGVPHTQLEGEIDNLIAMAEFIPIPATVSDFEPPTDDLYTTNALYERSYLVMLNGLSDDIPVGLFQDREEAVEFARDVRENPDVNAERYLKLIKANKEACRWLFVSVIEFSGPVPVQRTVLFDLD